MLRSKPQDCTAQGLVLRCPPRCDVPLQRGCSLWRKPRDEIQHMLNISTGQFDAASGRYRRHFGQCASQQALTVLMGEDRARRQIKRGGHCAKTCGQKEFLPQTAADVRSSLNRKGRVCESGPDNLLDQSPVAVGASEQD